MLAELIGPDLTAASLARRPSQPFDIVPEQYAPLLLLHFLEQARDHFTESIEVTGNFSTERATRGQPVNSADHFQIHGYIVAKSNNFISYCLSLLNTFLITFKLAVIRLQCRARLKFHSRP